MDIFDNILGQKTAKTVLEQTVKTDSYAQTYLFCGPAGTGKWTAATEFVMAAMCPASAQDAGQGVGQSCKTNGSQTGDQDHGYCGKCPTCRSVKRLSDIDLLVMQPEGASEYIVAQTKAMRDFLQYKPTRARRRCVIITDASLLNASSAGALLKTLEEPPGRSIIILLARTAQSVLETIVSRALVVPFVSLPKMSAVAELQKSDAIDPQAASLAIALTGGSVTAARSFWVSDQRRQTRHELMKLLLSLTDMTPNVLYGQTLQFVKLCNDNNVPPKQVYLCIYLFLSDCLKCSQAGGGGDYVNFDYATQITDFVRVLQSNAKDLQVKVRLIQAMEVMCASFANLTYNINIEVQFCALMAKLSLIFKLGAKNLQGSGSDYIECS